MLLGRFKAVVWDFNGTIVNDLSNSLCVINHMLRKRRLPLLTEEMYRSIFSFPVKAYYEKIGFNFNIENWSHVADEFINLYWENFYHTSNVFEDALKVIKYYKKLGIPQFILSAMHQDSLLECVERLDVSNLFDGIYGIDNHFASEKYQTGRLLISENKLEEQAICMIGDTIHDYEVANSIGADCFLVGCGHQSKERLSETGCVVVDNHLDLI